MDPDPSKPLAGLFCDAWSEIRRRSRQLVFHFTIAPGARRRQFSLQLPDPATGDVLSTPQAHDLAIAPLVRRSDAPGVMPVHLFNQIAPRTCHGAPRPIVAKSLAASGIPHALAELTMPTFQISGYCSRIE
jgi:hypothetical protein